MADGCRAQVRSACCLLDLKGTAGTSEDLFPLLLILSDLPHLPPQPFLGDQEGNVLEPRGAMPGYSSFG